MTGILKKVVTFTALSLLIGSALKVPHQKEEVKVEETPKVVDYSRSRIDDTKSVTFHYHRSDGNYATYDLWIWGDGQGGAEHDFTGEDTYGKYLTVSMADYTVKTAINVIIRPGSWSAQTKDLHIDLTEYTDVDNIYHVYLINMDNAVFKSSEEALASKITSATFTSETNIKATTFNEPSTYRVLEIGAEVAAGTVTGATADANNYYTFNVTLGVDHPADLEKQYELEIRFVDTTIVTRQISFGGLYDTETFKNTYVYDQYDLGANYSETSTTFKAWSPFSSEVKLRIYENGTPTDVDAVKGNDEYREFAMVKGAKGVWTYKLDENLHGKYYTYVVTNDTYTNEETPDPYAKAAGVNGRRGLVGDFSVTDPEGWDEVSLKSVPATKQITYELHVADFTGDATWNGQEENRTKYLGLIEEGTTYTQDGVTVKTGFDHLKELGVNAVQILPFFDQDNDEVNGGYNWGYNPHLYNVLDGIYSKNPYDGFVRMNEMKQVVKKFAEHDIRLIMDVVYNHVSSVMSNPLNVMFPDYYFRHNADGSLSNGTGVGNDTMSERAMFRHFMIDSTTFLAREYKLSGYRFDLMGYHTIDTMNAVSKAVREINPDFVLHGEPWKPYGGTKPDTYVSVPNDFAYYDNLTKLDDIAGFSDSTRDSLIGRVPFENGRTEGWVHLVHPLDKTGMQTHVTDTLLGRFSEWGSGRFVHDDPLKAVNYVSCHDNFTLYDKVRLGAQLHFAGQEERIQHMAVQAQSFVLLGQGLPFIHAGSEILRSKEFTASTPEIAALIESDPGDFKKGITEGTYISNNSYKWPIEVNSIKWDQKIDNEWVFKIYQELIALRLNTDAFSYTTREDIDNNVEVTWGPDLVNDNATDAVIRYTAKDANNTYIVYFVGATQRATLDVTGLQVVVDTKGVFKKGDIIDKPYRTEGGSFTLVLQKEITPVSTGSGLSAGAIVGIVVGSLAVVAAVASVIVVSIKKRKTPQK